MQIWEGLVVHVPRQHKAAFQSQEGLLDGSGFLRVDPETGKKRYHSEAVRGSKADAERRLTELQRELDIGAFSPPPS